LLNHEERGGGFDVRKKNIAKSVIVEDRSDGKKRFMIEIKICFLEEVASTAQFLAV
jgi:hypothetical protein